MLAGWPLWSLHQGVRMTHSTLLAHAGWVEMTFEYLGPWGCQVSLPFSARWKTALVRRSVANHCRPPLPRLSRAISRTKFSTLFIRKLSGIYVELQIPDSQCGKTAGNISILIHKITFRFSWFIPDDFPYYFHNIHLYQEIWTYSFV